MQQQAIVALDELGPDVLRALVLLGLGGHGGRYEEGSQVFFALLVSLESQPSNPVVFEELFNQIDLPGDGAFPVAALSSAARRR